MASNLQLELVDTPSVAANSAIVFNTVLTTNGNISYDNETGVINILEVGNYEFNWWVAAQSSNAQSGAVFAIVSSQGDSIIGTSPVKTAQVVGNCVIEVTSTPVTVELRNVSGSLFYFSSATSVRGGLTVVGRNNTSGAAVIPFANGADTSLLRTNASGGPIEVQLVSFTGHSNSIALAGESFVLPTGNNYQFTFTMPYDSIVKSIYITCSNWETFTPPAGASVYPFIVLATAPVGSNSFTLLTDTETITTTPWVGGVSNPAGTTLAGNRIDINVPITAGERVAICCAYRITGTPSAQGYYFYYSGGILLE